MRAALPLSESPCSTGAVNHRGLLGEESGKSGRGTAFGTATLVTDATWRIARNNERSLVARLSCAGFRRHRSYSDAGDGGSSMTWLTHCYISFGVNLDSSTSD